MAFFEFRTNPLYVQGPNALVELKRYSFHLGDKFLIATGCGPITDQAVAKVKQSFDNSMESNVQAANFRAGPAMGMAKAYDAMNKPVTYEIVDCEGQQVTAENIEKLTEKAKQMDANVIIGVGGGKVLDLVRGVYHKHRCAVVLCPTSVSTNAPASTLTVLYNDNDDIVGLQAMPYHPSLVLADMDLIIQAPAITLAAGMGDCMGTYYDSMQAVKDLNRESQVPYVAWEAINDSKQVFLENGYQAVSAAKRGVINAAVESCVSQIIHTSGPMSVTVAVHLPHIFDELLLHFSQCKYVLHGLLVGYGVIPYLVWANAPLEELYEYIDFCVSVGIPTNFKDLKIENEPMEKFVKAAEATCQGPTVAMTTAKITPADLYKNMFIADDIVKDYLGL